jgi:alkylated DNA repair dioxygenase AlkB
LGVECEIVSLKDTLPRHLQKDVPNAYILIVRNAVKSLLGDNDGLWDEQINLNHDKKAWMRGRVVNKHARWNLCFADKEQEPDYENKKGRVYSWEQVPLTTQIRTKIGQIMGKIGQDLMAEGNYYYDINDCGIGFHGDSERKKVIALRLGHDMDLQYQWYHEGNEVGERIKINLSHGDMYFMSSKAVGTDWKKRKIPTLRHATGCRKFLKMN